MPYLLRLIPVLSLLLLTSCASRDRDPNKLTFWTLQLSPTFDDYINGLVETFEAEHPGIDVEWVDVPYEGITQKFLSAISGGRAPDVVNLPADYVLKYVSLGVLAPLDTLLADSTRVAYLEAAMDPLQIDGGLYGVPWYLSTQILIYNRAKLETAGIDPDRPPQRYDGLLAFARDYQRRTGDYAFFYNLVVDSYLLEVLVSEGIPVVSEDGERALFNTPEAAAALRPWVETFRAGAMPRESIAQGHRAGLQLYQSGSIALFIGGPQYLRIIRENAPTLYETTDVAPAVTGSTGKKNLAVMSLSLSKTTANPEMAAAFAAFVTNAENQLEFARTVPVFPSVTAALDEPFFREHDGSLEARARVIAADQLSEAEVLKPSLENYNRLKEVFKAHILKVFLGDRSLEEALDAAAADWNKILAEDW